MEDLKVFDVCGKRCLKFLNYKLFKGFEEQILPEGMKKK
jgi:hypothetical protein